MTPIEKAAWWYAEHGFRLIPLEGKLPATSVLPLVKGKPSWAPYKARPNTKREIREWFSDTQFNIGLLTGYSGVVVVDCDSRDEAVWWWRNRAHTPMLAKTGNGIHYYYLSVEGVGNKAKLDGRNIDIRGYGGYVVAPPSVHENGNQYERVGGWALEDVPYFDIGWVGKRRSIPKPVEQNVSYETAMKYIGHITAVSGQNGHGNTFRAACKLAEFGLSETEAMGALSEWNKTNAFPAWSDWELQHKIDDAFKTVTAEQIR